MTMLVKDFFSRIHAVHPDVVSSPAGEYRITFASQSGEETVAMVDAPYQALVMLMHGLNGRDLDKHLSYGAFKVHERSGEIYIPPLPNQPKPTKGCPTCGHIPSNSRTHVSLDIPVAMLLSMVHALAIGRNTEMMCSSKDAADEMEAMRKTLFNQLGVSHVFFRDRDWTKIMLAAWKGASIETQVAKTPKEWNRFHVEVTLGEATYLSDRTLSLTEDEAKEALDKLKADIDRLCPMI